MIFGKINIEIAITGIASIAFLAIYMLYLKIQEIRYAKILTKINKESEDEFKANKYMDTAHKQVP